MPRLYTLTPVNEARENEAARLKPRSNEDDTPAHDPWVLNELVRRRRLRADAQRPLGVNLAEGLSLTEFLSGFTGVCRR
jgi:hypothetical protein